MNSTATAPLVINDLTVAYHEKPVLWDIDLTIPAGVLAAIVGPNGAGKSTLIKATLGLIPAVSGSVEFFGKPYEQQRRLVGYVPQRSSVDWDFPTNALDVVLMGTYGDRAKPNANMPSTALTKSGWPILPNARSAN